MYDEEKRKKNSVEIPAGSGKPCSHKPMKKTGKGSLGRMH
jgi:hypothetical protein